MRGVLMPHALNLFNMNKKTTYLIGLFSTLFFGALLQWYFCCDGNSKEVNAKQAAVGKTDLSSSVDAIPFSFSDGPVSIKSQDNLNFFKSGYAIIGPISEHLQSCLKELAVYFKNNPNKALYITGWYSDEENNLSNHKTLGHARAWAIKNRLKNLGLPKNQIKINGKASDSLKANGENILIGPYRFETLINENSDSKLLALKKAAQKHTVLVRFSPGRSYKNLTPEEQNRLNIIAKYLNASSTASCTIVGHTDSVKSEQSNLILGKKRAEFTKVQLVKLHVDPKKIKTQSKGESSPIATNTTKQGKTQNRRTEIQLN